MISWTPAGFVGEMLKVVSGHLAPPPGVEPPPRWGTEDYLRELLGDRVAEVSFHAEAITQRFPSADFFADFFIDNYGPTKKASEALGDEGRTAFRSDLVDFATRMNRAQDGAAVSEWEYFVAVARCA